MMPFGRIFVACHTFNASTVCATSCTRMIAAPRSAAHTAAATLAGDALAPSLRPVTAPSIDLRDMPARIGNGGSPAGRRVRRCASNA